MRKKYSGQQRRAFNHWAWEQARQEQWTDLCAICNQPIGRRTWGVVNKKKVHAACQDAPQERAE